MQDQPIDKDIAQPDMDLKGRVLIVDDEVASMNALCDTLGDQGYFTAGFASAKAALEALPDSGGFDVLLTDLMMPDMNGVELLAAALKVDPYIIGVLMTGQGSIATAVQAMQAGAFDYVLKPFKVSLILPVLARAMSVRQLRREKAALEHSLRRRTAELEAANRDLEAFSYSVSHDLRAPLRAVDGFARILEEDHAGQLDEEGRRLLGIVRNGAVDMGRLIEDLLEFSASGRQPLRVKEVDMQALAGQAAALFTGEYPGVDLRIGALPAAMGDESLLKQVWANLIGNALKYSSKVPAPRVEVGGEADSRLRRYWVRDNGAGFKMEAYDRLFSPFRRLHGAEEFPGTGIGLALSKRIVLRHEGRIWGEGKEGEGATFWFELPA